MQTRIRELPVPAVAGGLVALGGVALWQLGIEFERAWMRSYEEPLPGDRLPGNRASAPQLGQSVRTSTTIGEHRRWLKRNHPLEVPRAAGISTRP
jgi:hypothetical protein